MKTHYPFVAQYTVAVFDEEEKVMRHYHHSCLGFCESFTDAVAQIEETEGFGELESINHLEIFDEESHLIEIDPNWVDEIIKRDFFSEAIDNGE